MLIESFPAVIGTDARVLILGSLPGERSLAAGEYYAHPRNRFWPVMRELIGLEPDLPYLDRIDLMTRAGIALWDVLERCRRAGSLDHRIVQDSEVANDIKGLLLQHASVGAVALNGRKAATAFRRRVLPDLGVGLAERVDIVELPSTSPANARWSLPDLLGAWRVILPYLYGDSSPSGSGPRVGPETLAAEG